MRKPSEMYVALRMHNMMQICAQNACFATKLHFSPQQMLISFSPGRDRSCRHYWISSFWMRSGRTATIVFVILFENHLDPPPSRKYK